MTYFQELKYTIKLAIPLLITMLMQTGGWFINSIFMGHLGRDALAAGALVLTSYFLIIIPCYGFINAIGVCVGQANGAQDKNAVQHYLHHGTYLALFLSIPVFALLWNAHHIFLYLHQPPENIELIKQLLHGIAWGTVGTLGYALIKEFYSNLEAPSIAMYTSLLGLGMIIVFDFGFTFGAFGLPALGMFGIGLANSIGTWTMFISLAIYTLVRPALRDYWTQGWGLRLNRKTLNHLIRLGLPLALTYFFEIGLFNVTAIFMGWISIDALAAHQIILQWTDLVFVCFLAIGQTAAIRLANTIGQQQYNNIYTIIGVIMTLFIIIDVFFSLLFHDYTYEITRPFLHAHESHDQAIEQLSHSFFQIAIVFIFFDGLQIIGNNVLRSIKDTFIPMVLNLGTYWLFGVGGAIVMAFEWHWYAQGIWLGLTFGVFISAATLWIRIYQRM